MLNDLLPRVLQEWISGNASPGERAGIAIHRMDVHARGVCKPVDAADRPEKIWPHHPLLSVADDDKLGATRVAHLTESVISRTVVDVVPDASEGTIPCALLGLEQFQTESCQAAARTLFSTGHNTGNTLGSV